MSAVPKPVPQALPESDVHPPEPLFRPEAIADRQSQWLGAILLETNVVHSAFAGIAVFAMLALACFLVLGSFTRKASVGGWLVPQQGLARVVAPQPGTVSHINVREGEAVAKGTPLVTISAEVTSEALVSTREEVVRRLSSRRDSMATSKATQGSLFDQQASDTARRVESLLSEQGFLAKEIELQRARVGLSRQMLARETEMRARGLIPLPRLQRIKQEELDQSAKFQSLERSRAALQRDLVQAQGQRLELPLRREAQLGEIDRGVSGLEQELAEAEARRKIVLVAPQDGVVTSLQAELGGSVNASVPLLTVVPANAILQAHLYSTSRGIGFLKPGQRVQLRFQAFPYQKFGFHEGVVSAVSRSASSPSELPQHLAGAGGAIGGGEPVYRITVDLPSQQVKAYGQPLPLQAGMRVDADVLIESRRLIEWIFDPLLTITGKWNG